MVVVGLDLVPQTAQMGADRRYPLFLFSVRLCAICSFFLFAAAAGAGAVERFEYSAPHMGTLWRVVIYAEDAGRAEDAAAAAFARVAELDGVMSDYQAGSEVRGLGAAPVVVSPDLLAVLIEAKRFGEDSGGAFDVTAGALTKLWRRAIRRAELPEEGALQAAREATGIGGLVISEAERVVRLAKPGMRVDLGGIGKCFALDAAMAVLRDGNGVGRALVDAGGDVLAGDGEWTIRVEGNGAPFVVRASRMAVATSGDLHQGAAIGGRRYSHIIDPRTGIALDDGAAATVVAPEATAADALASALCVVGEEDGRALLRKHKRAAARVTRRLPSGDLAVWESEGFPAED
ncbi:hypothetical protein BH23VER1_BH23VER1_06230 [soil metagenome]